MTSSLEEQEEQETNLYVSSYSERRRIREQLQSADVSGESLDPAIKCKCPECGIVHFRPRKEN